MSLSCYIHCFEPNLRMNSILNSCSPSKLSTLQRTYSVVYTNASHYSIPLSSTCRAIDCFNKVLSQSSTFARAGEIHLRLGVMFKTKGDYRLSMEHFQKALAITGPASFSRLESKFALQCVCVCVCLSVLSVCECVHEREGGGECLFHM